MSCMNFSFPCFVCTSSPRACEAYVSQRLAPKCGEDCTGSALARAVRRSGRMCPLRVILLFLSAALAGYFALKAAKAQAARPGTPDEQTESTGLHTKVSTGTSSGFWVMVDMLSGRYLYHNLKGQAKA